MSIFCKSTDMYCIGNQFFFLYPWRLICLPVVMIFIKYTAHIFFTFFRYFYVFKPYFLSGKRLCIRVRHTLAIYVIIILICLFLKSVNRHITHRTNPVRKNIRSQQAGFSFPIEQKLTCFPFRDLHGKIRPSIFICHTQRQWAARNFLHALSFPLLLPAIYSVHVNILLIDHEHIFFDFLFIIFSI